MRIDEIAKPKFIMLVGVPGSGKSTWIDEFVSKSPDNWVILSTDQLVDEWAQQNGVSYSEAFAKIDFKQIQKSFDHKLADAISKKQNIIWDQTNTQPNARRKKLNMIPEFYETAAIAFEVSLPELKRRLDDRSAKTGKSIPDNVMADMISKYVPPSRSEGFDTVHFVRK